MHFLFSQRTLLNNVVIILFHCFLPLFRQLLNSTGYLFLSKELFKVPFTVFGGNGNFFYSESFVKAKINGNLMVQCLVNMANESELPSQAVTVFALVIKEMCCLVFSQWKINNFCWIIPGTFCCMIPSIGLIGSSVCWN